LARKRGMRRCLTSFALQRGADCARAFRRRLSMRRSAARRGVLRRLCARLFISIFRRRQLDTRAPGLGQSDRDRLLGGARPVLSFPNVVHFFAHEFPGLRTGCFPLARVLSGARSFSSPALLQSPDHSRNSNPPPTCDHAHREGQHQRHEDGDRREERQHGYVQEKCADACQQKQTGETEHEN